MAIGGARMFGIQLPFNFNSPYKARNIQDFWGRWHMTLSRWLKEYLYIPLGGNRKGPLLTYRNLFLVFLLGGIWHGAGWTFVAWGALHGVGSVFFRFWSRWKVPMPRVFAVLITFLYAHLGWVFFRAPDLPSAWVMIQSMFGFGVQWQGTPVQNWLGRMSEGLWVLPQKVSGGFFQDHVVMYLIAVSVVAFFGKNSLELALKEQVKRPIVTGIAYALLAWVTLIVGIRAVQSPFLYFNF